MSEVLRPHENGEISTEKINIGNTETIKTIPSRNTENGIVNAEFYRFTNYIEYPPIVVEALALILDGLYNPAFHNVLQLRQPEAYKPAYINNGKFKNLMVQVDIAGLPLSFLEGASGKPIEELQEIIINRMFEAENSLAMYNLMRGIFSPQATETYSPQSFFGINFDSALEMYRNYFNAPIVLAAVTEGKYEAMLTSEFGVLDPRKLTEERVRLLSGFDRFVGPKNLEGILTHQSNPQIIFYMRTSYPTSWLRNPAKNTPFSIPLLENPEFRAKIRDRAITPNVDDPEVVNEFIGGLSTGKYRLVRDDNYHFALVPTSEMRGRLYPPIVNDTKEYLAYLGYPIIVKPEDIELLLESSQGYRLKPLSLHYGGYGHIRIPGGKISGKIIRKKRIALDEGLKTRGPYIAQPEIPPYIFEDQNGKKFAAIHRVFFAYDPYERRYKFIGGLFNAIPVDSTEVKRGRIHGNKQAVWGQIVTTQDENIVVNPDSLNYIFGKPANRIRNI